MAYGTYEESQSSGSPGELYEWVLGSDVYYMTSGSEEFTSGANTYIPTAITRGSLNLGSEERQQNLVVQMPSDEPIAQAYRQVPPGQMATLTIKRFHYTDSPTPALLVIFKGAVKSVAFTEEGNLAEFAVLPMSSRLTREIPRFSYQGLCNHMLYDTRCQVAQNSFKFTDVVATETQNGSAISVIGLSGQPDGYYNGGFVQQPGGDWRLILTHIGNNLTLLVPFSQSILGETVDVFAGCDHSIATCKSKFNNVVNYGGFAFVPLNNPFSSGID